MPAYLAHAARERARFRHGIFSEAGNRSKAMSVLQKCDGVVGVKPGVNSVVAFFESGTNLEAICRELERTFPELNQPPSPPEARRRKDANPKSAVGAGGRRKLELKALLTTGAATVGLAIIGTHRLHIWAGGLFTLLASRHIWERRGRL